MSDEITKIIKLVEEGMLSRADAITLFKKWQSEGREIMIDQRIMALINEKQKSIKGELSQNDIDENIQQEIITILAKILKMDAAEIRPTTTTQSLGLDSVTASEFAAHFIEKYKIPIMPTILFEVSNIDELIQYFVKNTRQSIADYQLHHYEDARPNDDVTPTGPTLVVEDDQNISHIKDGASFSGGEDFNSFWGKLEQRVEHDQNIETAALKPILSNETLHVDIGNDVLEFLVYGSGKPILLIGGISTHADLWENQLPLLVEKYKVYLYYPPGCGHSTLLETPEISTITAALHRALESLSILEPIPIIAYSAGGSIAMKFTIDYPLQVKSLILLSTSAKHIESENAFENMTNEFKKLKQTHVDAEKYLPFTSGEITKYYKSLYDQYDIENDLTNIQSPALIMFGEEDTYVSKESTLAIKDGIAHAETLSIEHAGHYPMLTHPKLINQAILEFAKKYFY